MSLNFAREKCSENVSQTHNFSHGFLWTSILSITFYSSSCLNPCEFKCITQFEIRLVLWNPKFKSVWEHFLFAECWIASKCLFTFIEIISNTYWSENDTFANNREYLVQIGQLFRFRFEVIQPTSATNGCIFYFSLKLECEKLAQEKTEIQRQYIMVSFSFHSVINFITLI